MLQHRLFKISPLKSFSFVLIVCGITLLTHILKLYFYCCSFISLRRCIFFLFIYFILFYFLIVLERKPLSPCIVFSAVAFCFIKMSAMDMIKSLSSKPKKFKSEIFFCWQLQKKNYGLLNWIYTL